MATRTVCADCARAVSRFSSLRGFPSARPRHNRLIACVRPTSSQRPRHASTFKPAIAGRARTSATSLSPLESSSIPSSAPPIDPGITTRVAASVRSAAPSMTETYVAYGACETLVNECARLADYSVPQAQEKDGVVPKTSAGEDVGVGTGWWYDAPGLAMEPTFSSWTHVTMLHMWLLTVRLRAFPKEHAAAWHQHLINHFFFRAEDRMAQLHQITANGARQRYLKDLFVQWRGILAAYDEGLVRGDAVLAAAVWRNLCKADPRADLRRLAEVVSYMRSVLRQFDEMTDEVIASGDVVFGDPSGEAALVKLPSQIMKDPDGEV